MSALTLKGPRHCMARMISGIVTILIIFARIIIVVGRSVEFDEIEAHLNRLNKPSVKSFKLGSGEIVDCVDIYEQPAFDHPLIKDHKILMPPSSLPEMDKNFNYSKSGLQKTDECPEGTIPIRKVHRRVITRASSLRDFGRLNQHIGHVEVAGATLRTGRTYFGARAHINTWKVMVEKGEWSRASVEMSDGKNKNIVHAGWIVNPQVYGDGLTRMYAYWTADGYKKTGCFDLLCPGFVQVSRVHILGVSLHPLSSYGGGQYYLETAISKDDWSRVWWLYLNSEPVGYWPMEIFDGAFGDAWDVKWTGAVLNLNRKGMHTTTQMGSGRFAGGGWAQAAYFCVIEVRDGLQSFALLPYNRLGFTANRIGCYNIMPLDGSIVFFGGPGGHECASS